ncbi:hypothetical protein HD599_002491 [Conyzicola lurida]|uniref:PH domain-containing protein n=1 Tax=Conyzicola lurida TaxID=1172621 RepID=A0A841APC6_9MICO|nr:hypothetical protein [Conyzicola lurida]MBB5844168.1 hypothetical protein [Conyzicola lurida]
MAELPHGWVVVGPKPSWRMVLGTRIGVRIYPLILLVVTGPQVARMFASNDDSTLVTVVALVLAVVVAAVSVALIVAAQRPRLNFDTSQLRVGRKTIGFADLTTAMSVGLPRGTTTDWSLQIGRGSAAPLLFTVRSTRDPELSDSDRELVAELLRRSSVALPAPKSDRDDPTGKFAWMDHPNHLSRDEAIEWVLNTPESGEPVRARNRRKSPWINDD